MKTLVPKAALHSIGIVFFKLFQPGYFTKSCTLVNIASTILLIILLTVSLEMLNLWAKSLTTRFNLSLASNIIHCWNWLMAVQLFGIKDCKNWKSVIRTANDGKPVKYLTFSSLFLNASSDILNCFISSCCSWFITWSWITSSCNPEIVFIDTSVWTVQSLNVTPVWTVKSDVVECACMLQLQVPFTAWSLVFLAELICCSWHTFLFSLEHFLW